MQSELIKYREVPSTVTPFNMFTGVNPQCYFNRFIQNTNNNIHFKANQAFNDKSMY